MTRKHRKTLLAGQKTDQNHQSRKPFWLSSLNYYILTAGISMVCFFLTWGVLHSVEEEMPWITAGLLSGLVLILAVILREFVFKKAYQRSLIAQKRLDQSLRRTHRNIPQKQTGNRLTLENNAAFIQEIESKSKRANSLGSSANMHFEVFELCNEYLRKSNKELDGLYKSSPRFAALRNGQIKIKRLHKYHLFCWASIESQLYVQTAKIQSLLNDKIENAQRALAVLDTANQFYPDDENLIQSKDAINEFISSIKVSHWMEQGERATFKNQYQRAVNHYRDALFFLARENIHTPERDALAEEINLRIEIIREKIEDTK